MITRLKQKLGLSPFRQIQGVNAIPAVSLGDLLGADGPDVMMSFFVVVKRLTQTGLKFH
jgi:hypothetical protein